MRKYISYYIAIITAVALLLPVVAKSQITVVGHVYAEVVESVSAKLNAVTHVAFSRETDLSQASFDLGSVLVGAGNTAYYDVVMTNNAFSDARGNMLNIEIETQLGSKNIDLKGRAVIDHSLPGENYSGSYTMVVAYN